MTVYHDNVETEPLLNHAILAIDMPKDTKFYKIYTQAWKNVTLTLLQRPKTIQLIINALMYNHAFHYLSTRDILSLDKLIKRSPNLTLSRILLTDYNLTTKYYLYPSPLPSLASPESALVPMIATLSMNDTPTLVAQPNPKKPTVTPVNSSIKRTQSPYTSNGRLFVTITSDNQLLL